MIAARLLRPLMLCALVAFVLWGFGRWRYHQGWQQAAGEAAQQRQQQRLAMANQAQRAEAQYRDQEQRWQSQQQQAQTQAEASLAAAREDATAARAVARRLHQQVARLSAAGGGSPNTTAAADVGLPTPDAVILLADLFGRADRRAAELAEYADRARTAGLACQQAWPEVNHSNSMAHQEEPYDQQLSKPRLADSD